MHGAPFSFFHPSSRASWRAWLSLGMLAATLGAHATTPAPVAPASAGMQPAADGLVFGPYKHLLTSVDPDKPTAATTVTGPRLALADANHAALLPSANSLSLAFASGECGQERWKARDATVVRQDAAPAVQDVDLDAAAVAQANIAALQAAGYRYIISTGGEGNVFTCTSDAGMDAFVAHYDGPSLIGFDFDIEAGQTSDQVNSLVQRIKTLQERRPELRISFTLPTHGASDAGQASLNAQGQQVLAAIREAGLARYTINLMVMDFGAASDAVCVVRNGRCDMAASASQAARNLHVKFGVPMAQIELTPMLGVNDVVDNVFSPADAVQLAQFVRKEKLGGLHYWSLDRDTPCANGTTVVSPTCSSLNTLPILAFARAFSWGLR